LIFATAQFQANRRAGGGTQKRAGLDIGDVQPNPHRTMAHADHRAGQVGRFQGARITLSP
jgi:hypothetical protein